MMDRDSFGCLLGVCLGSVLIERIYPDEAHGGLLLIVVVDAQFGEIFIFLKFVVALPRILHKAVR